MKQVEKIIVKKQGKILKFRIKLILIIQEPNMKTHEINPHFREYKGKIFGFNQNQTRKETVDYLKKGNDFISES